MERKRKMNPSFDQALTRFLDSRPGATGCVAVAQLANGQRWEAAAGHDGQGRFLSVRATFRIASITKTFTATAILRLSEQGVLGLDDSLGRFLDHDLIEMLSVIDGRFLWSRDITSTLVAATPAGSTQLMVRMLRTC